MKQNLQIIWICMKRMLMRPWYIALFLLMPIVSGLVINLWKTEDVGPKIGICVEECVENERIIQLIEETSGIFDVLAFDSEEQLKRATLKGDVDCGFAWDRDLMRLVKNGTYQGKVLCVLSPETSMANMAKEKIAACIFQVYSEETYREYERPIDEAYAWEKYQEHLYDGSTFQFEYEGGEHILKEVTDVATEMLPLRGILAVFVFMISLCSVLEYTKERKEGRLVNLRKNGILFVGTVWIPCFFAGQMLLVSLAISGQSSSGQATMGMGSGIMLSITHFLQEELWILIYVFVLLVYGYILSKLVGKNTNRLLAIIPILGVLSFIVAPIFVDLSGIVPAIKIARWFLPVTYYLNMI